MPFFRKKPITIEAIQLTHENRHKVSLWCNGINEGMSVTIVTLEGAMKAVVGDYIIKGVKGEFYPCKPDIFEATYEPVENEIESVLD